MNSRSAAALARPAVIGVMFLVTSHAHSAEWAHVAGIDADGSYLAVDKTSIVPSGKLRKAWFKWVYVLDKAKPVPPAAKASLEPLFYTEQLNLTYFNCAERTSTNVQAIYRDKNGEVVGQYLIGLKNAFFSEVAPETIGESMLLEVCKAPVKPNT